LAWLTRMTRVRLTRELAADGFSPTELSALRRSGTLHRVRRGAYADSPEPLTDPVDRHRMLLEATVLQLSADAVVSHMSAAALHGLPTWNQELHRVHLTRNRDGGGKVRRYTHLHTSPLPPEDVVEIGGRPVTSLARTVVDLSRTLTMVQSVPIGDAALRLGLDRDDLSAIAARCVGWSGITRARRAIGFLDARGESVGESSSRVVLYQAGVPAPELQLEAFDPLGRLVGRADFGWKDHRTLGEFDGRVKYGRLLKPGQSTADAVFEEKRREDALRSLGWEVVRWLWEDLRDPSQLRQRLEMAFARGRRAS
jgi:hypothetical protein